MEEISGLFVSVGISAVSLAVTVGVKQLCRKYMKGQSKYDDK